MINFKNAKKFEASPFNQRWGSYGKFCLDKVVVDGLWLEFGVATGATSEFIINNKNNDKILYGFDWFKGLPEEWKISDKNIKKKGELFGSRFNVEPNINGLKIINGLFEETLGTFFEKNTENIAYMHIDCDLYSSTKTILKHAKSAIVPGTIIMFDEFYGYDNYREGEYKAWTEFVNDNNVKYEWIAYCYKSITHEGHQACCVIK